MIIQNALMVDGKIIISTHRHDYVEHNGIAVDGGFDYCRWVGDIYRDGVRNICLSEISPMDNIKRDLLVHYNKDWKFATLCSNEELNVVLERLSIGEQTNVKNLIQYAIRLIQQEKLEIGCKK